MKGWQCTTKDNEMFIKKRLKAEGVKCVKRLNKRIKALKKEPECKRNTDYEEGWKHGVIHFNNLTEEDLSQTELEGGKVKNE